MSTKVNYDAKRAAAFKAMHEAKAKAEKAAKKKFVAAMLKAVTPEVWNLYDSNGQVKAGPFNSELEVDTHLVELKQKFPGEETDGLHYRKEQAVAEEPKAA